MSASGTPPVTSNWFKHNRSTELRLSVALAFNCCSSRIGRALQLASQILANLLRRHLIDGPLMR